MAYVINNNNGESGYTRAAFESALEGKQDLLVSGTNIKTVNGNSVLGSENLEVSAREYTYDLTQEETALKNQAIQLLNTDNPIDQTTGKRKYLSFAFITDLHTTPTQAEILADDSVPSTIKSAWPVDSALSYDGLSCEPSLKVLGAFAHESGLDLVVCGGDFSDGHLPFDCYAYMLGKVSQMFDQYISVPYFAVDGNHDRRYSSSVARRTNGIWRTFLESFNKPKNLDFHYADVTGVTIEDSVSNCGYIDFADKKVRLILRSQYEIAQADNATLLHGGGGTATPLSSLLPDSSKKDWTIIYAAHTGGAGAANFVNYLSSDAFGTPLGSAYIGRAAAGEIRGHNHMSIHSNTSTFTIADTGGSNSGNACPFCRWLVAESFTNKSNPEYCFSLITVNTDNHTITERKIGRAYHNLPDNQLGSEVNNKESTYVGNYGYLADISQRNISCESIGNNQYQLSISGNDKPYTKWSVSNVNTVKDYIKLTRLDGILTIKDTMTEAMTLRFTASSGTSISGEFTVGPYINEENNE